MIVYFKGYCTLFHYKLRKILCGQMYIAICQEMANGQLLFLYSTEYVCVYNYVYCLMPNALYN